MGPKGAVDGLALKVGKEADACLQRRRSATAIATDMRGSRFELWCTCRHQLLCSLAFKEIGWNWPRSVLGGFSDGREVL